MQFLARYTRAQQDNATASADKLPINIHAGQSSTEQNYTIMACMQQNLQCDTFANSHTRNMAAHAISMSAPRLLTQSSAEHVHCNQQVPKKVFSEY
jgi:hypothetical protein